MLGAESCVNKSIFSMQKSNPPKLCFGGAGGGAGRGGRLPCALSRFVQGPDYV